VYKHAGTITPATKKRRIPLPHPMRSDSYKNIDLMDSPILEQAKPKKLCNGWRQWKKSDVLCLCHTSQGVRATLRCMSSLMPSALSPTGHLMTAMGWAGEPRRSLSQRKASTRLLKSTARTRGDGQRRSSNSGCPLLWTDFPWADAVTELPGLRCDSCGHVPQLLCWA